ncbi:MAG: DnaJ domain-containing protein [Desulfosarcinaceae bacterium]|nr:DnaJ domain-containing protein [Desulfosarcinaceae bacterium]
MEQKDYYQVLGVQKSASQQEIKEAYRDLALRYHPDRNSDSQVSADRMKGINEAYAVLSDHVKRKDYDLLRDQLGASAHGQFRQTYSDQDIFRGSDVQQIFEEVARSFGLRGFDEIFKEIHGAGRGNLRGGFGFKQGGFRGCGFTFLGSFSEAGRRFGRRHGRRDAGAGRWRSFKPAGLGGGGFDPGRLLDSVRRAFTAMLPMRDGGHAHDTIVLTPELARTGGPYAYLAPHTKKKLIVKIPPNVRAGQMIRLAGMGKQGQNGGRSGDLYLQVRIKSSLMERLKRGLSRSIKR